MLGGRLVTARRPVAVAVTGAIGAGKSEALRAFGRHGAATVSADELVHRIYRDDDAVKKAIRDRWGDAVFIDGEVDRAAVAGIVFEDRDELEWLEGLLHPRVVEEQQRWLENVTAPIAVVEIPLLYETGADRRFDAVVVVTAPEPVRAGRAGVPLAGRSDRLLPDEEKMQRADFAYVNDGSFADLDAFVAGVVERLTA